MAAPVVLKIVLKIGVLADAVILLDGRPIALAELQQTLDKADKGNTVVWYDWQAWAQRRALQMELGR